MSSQFVDGTRILTNAECESSLGRSGVGILALCGIEAPVLRPVNYMRDHGVIFIRTGEGQILEAAQGGEPASFAVSHIDAFEHTGWSVVITGKLIERASSGDLDERLVRAWARAKKDHIVALSIDQISGRELQTGGGEDGASA